MNTNGISKHYGNPTAEERFRLILAASGRGDKAERDRLANAGERIHVSMAGHAPYSEAFDKLATLIFVELVEEAARYAERWRAVPVDEEQSTPLFDAKGNPLPALRLLNLALAHGHVLRTKAHGWKLFCERLNVPPFLAWEGLPGLDRLRSALDAAEELAFRPEGFQHWLNSVRPAGEPERTGPGLTAENVASETLTVFHQLAKLEGA